MKLPRRIGDHPLVGEVRSFGLLGAIEIVKALDLAARDLVAGRN